MSRQDPADRFMVMGSQQRFWRPTPRTKNRTLLHRYSVSNYPGRGVYAPATFCYETLYLCSGFGVKNFWAQTGLCCTGTVFGTVLLRGVYARALLFYETSYLCSGILLLRAVLPRLSLELVGRW